MNKILFLVLLLSSVLFGANKCVSCHGGIEHIREESSGMMKAILEVAQKAGHEGNDCIVCPILELLSILKLTKDQKSFTQLPVLAG